jgi:hypothetical protein
MRGKLLPLLYYNSTIQSSSLSTCAQKKYLRFMDATNTRLPVCCSMMHMCSPCIMFANLFFALREIGVTNAVFMISMRLYVYSLDAVRISTRFCVPLVRLSRDLDEIVYVSRLDYHSSNSSGLYSVTSSISSSSE